MNDVLKKFLKDIKNITIASSSTLPVHEPLVKYIKEENHENLYWHLNGPPEAVEGVI